MCQLHDKVACHLYVNSESNAQALLHSNGSDVFVSLKKYPDGTFLSAHHWKLHNLEENEDESGENGFDHSYFKFVILSITFTS